MIDIIVNRLSLLDTVLIPVSRFNEKVSLDIHKDGVINVMSYTMTSNNAQIFMMSSIKTEMQLEEDITLHIGDVKKLITALKHIPDDIVNLRYDGSTIMYNSSGMRFKFHLLDDSQMSKISVTKESLDSLKGVSSFWMSQSTLREFLQTTSCLSNVTKLYINSVDGEVRCAQTDKQNPSADTLDMLLSNEYQGSEIKEVIICEDIFKILIGNKFSACKVEIVDKGLAVIFSIETDVSCIKYVVPCNEK